MTKRAAFAPVALLLAACSSGAAATQEHAARLSEPIVNGTPSTSTDDAVVYISIGNQGEFCTGTLITPNLVITARHCTWNMNEDSDCGTFTSQMQASSISIAIGVQVGDTVATATKIFVDTPKGNSGCGNDIALFQLDQDVPGAMVAPVRFTALAVGEPARTIGYGDDGSGTPTDGRYEKTGLAINATGPANYTYMTKKGQGVPVDLPAGEIVVGESTCFGDSGGPLMDAMGNVVGVTSRGVDQECRDRPSIFSDTASHTTLIMDAAATAGHPLTAATPEATDAGTTSSSSGGDDAPSTSGGLGSSSGGSTTAPTPAPTPSDGTTTTTSSCTMSHSAPARSDFSTALALMVGLALVSRRKRT